MINAQRDFAELRIAWANTNVLTIRKEQMAVFAAMVRRAFEECMSARLRSTSAIATALPLQEVDQRIRMLIGVAERNGVQEEQDVRGFIEQNFDRSSRILQDAAVLRILESTRVPASEKVRQIAALVKSDVDRNG